MTTGITPNSEDKTLEAGLAKALGFDPADLKDNRAGRISTKQMLALTYKGIVPLLELIVPFVGVITTAIALALFGPLIIGKLLFLVIASRRLLLLVLDLAMGKSAQLAGKVTISHSDDIEDGINQVLRKRTMMHYFVQGEHSFQVPQAAYEELYANGGAGHLRLHFTPKSQFLLSAEPSTAAATKEVRDQAA